MWRQCERGSVARLCHAPLFSELAAALVAARNRAQTATSTPDRTVLFVRGSVSSNTRSSFSSMARGNRGGGGGRRGGRGGGQQRAAGGGRAPLTVQQGAITKSGGGRRGGRGGGGGGGGGQPSRGGRGGQGGRGRGGRGAGRGRGGRGRGGDNKKRSVTDLDADLDSYMLKDKDTGKKHLDLDLDDYFKQRGKGAKGGEAAAATDAEAGEGAKAEDVAPMES